MNRALPWIVALLISLTANGVMTGIVLHRVVGSPHVTEVMPHADHPPHRRRAEGGRTGGFNVRAFVRHLPEEQRALARQRFQAERGRFRELMLDARAAQAEAEAAMLSEPYDPDAVAEALDTLRARRFAIEAAMEDVVLELVADLPPEARRTALAAGRRPPGRDGRHGRRRPPPSEPF
jgi:uncharacterized membrane protein